MLLAILPWRQESQKHPLVRQLRPMLLSTVMTLLQSTASNVFRVCMCLVLPGCCGQGRPVCVVGGGRGGAIYRSSPSLSRSTCCLRRR